MNKKLVSMAALLCRIFNITLSRQESMKPYKKYFAIEKTTVELGDAGHSWLAVVFLI
jgi:hypothetical protein